MSWIQKYFKNYQIVIFYPTNLFFPVESVSGYNFKDTLYIALGSQRSIHEWITGSICHSFEYLPFWSFFIQKVPVVVLWRIFGAWMAWTLRWGDFIGLFYRGFMIGIVWWSFLMYVIKKGNLWQGMVLCESWTRVGRAKWVIFKIGRNKKMK